MKETTTNGKFAHDEQHRQIPLTIISSNSSLLAFLLLKQKKSKPAKRAIPTTPPTTPPTIAPMSGVKMFYMIVSLTIRLQKKKTGKRHNARQ
jgi:hypothetical protein